jgi:hypothetical protein
MHMYICISISIYKKDLYARVAGAKEAAHVPAGALERRRVLDAAHTHASCNHVLAPLPPVLLYLSLMLAENSDGFVGYELACFSSLLSPRFSFISR